MKNITEKFEEKYYEFLFHYYRAEVYRETSWRSRLDVTTNWSIVVTAAMLSIVFGQSQVSHTVIIINYLIVWFFLYVEARRFRYYSRVRERVKQFEKKFLGPLFKGDKTSVEGGEWLNEMGDKLINQKMNMSKLEALSWRLRRNYIFIFLIIFVVWVYKVMSSPVPSDSLFEFFENARVWQVPGVIVFMIMLLTLCIEFWIAFNVSRKHSGEDLP